MVDTLRYPPLLDPTAAAYKDWLHLNLFDHRTGAIGIVNASVHGAEEDPRSRVIGTTLVHLPDQGWAGNMEVVGRDQAEIGTSSIMLERMGVGIDGAGTVLAKASFPGDQLHLAVTARPVSRSFDLPASPFGSGWIAWHAVPRLVVEGAAVLGGRRLTLDGTCAYHDHNWGRWHWGEDIGWEWGSCVSLDPVLSIVGGRTTDRDRTRTTGTIVVVELEAERRIYLDASVRFRYTGRLEVPLRRLPGSVAALHQDRKSPLLPQRIEIRVNDGVDTLEIELVPRAGLQLLAADPARRGTTYIHELPCRFSARGRIGSRPFQADGLAVFEYVD
jgi:hypothetical protein